MHETTPSSSPRSALYVTRGGGRAVFCLFPRDFFRCACFSLSLSLLLFQCICECVLCAGNLRKSCTGARHSDETLPPPPSKPIKPRGESRDKRSKGARTSARERESAREKERERESLISARVLYILEIINGRTRPREIARSDAFADFFLYFSLSPSLSLFVSRGRRLFMQRFALR